MSIFKVGFDNPVHAYLPGQTISGSVTFEMHSVNSSDTVIILFKGEAYTSWTATGRTCHGKGEEQVTQYESQVVFCRKEKEIWPNQEQGQAVFSHQSAFSFTLENHFPQSFEGTFGSVCYKLAIEHNGREAFSELIPVLSLPNLAAPLTSGQIVLEKKETIGYPNDAFTSASIEAEAIIPQSRFVAGETMTIPCYVSSTKTIELNCLARLMKRTGYRAAEVKRPDRYQLRTEEHVIDEDSMKVKVNSNHLKVSLCLEIKIPSSAPASLDDAHCSIINIDYFVQIEFRSTCYVNSTVEMCHVVEVIAP